jgi:hypothetical protein
MFIMEGDTPSFLGLIPNGLNAQDKPDWGGWGGRYLLRQSVGEPQDLDAGRRRLHAHHQRRHGRWPYQRSGDHLALA